MHFLDLRLYDGHSFPYRLYLLLRSINLLDLHGNFLSSLFKGVLLLVDGLLRLLASPLCGGQFLFFVPRFLRERDGALPIQYQVAVYPM